MAMASMMAYYSPTTEEFAHEQQQQQQWYSNVNDDLRAMSSSVHEKVESISQSSGFLSSPCQAGIPCFDRCDVDVDPRMLGQGAFSTVYAITHLHLNGDNVKGTAFHRKRNLAEHASGHGYGRSPFALKQLRGDLMGDKENFENAAIDLCLEVKFLTRLNHPNIIKVRGLANGWTSAFSNRHDGFFIIMDRLESLDVRINRWRDRLYRFPGAKQPSLTRKMHYASQVADAISYLHDHRIIFRDLKSQNVGFKADDTVQLFDFGLARELPKASSRGEDETFLMSGVGTRRFMAPEIVNSNTYNAKADCYSWAMTVVEMLTLQKPYPHYSSDQHAEFVCKQGERPNLARHGIPPVLQELLEQSWCQDVRQRLTMRDICYQLYSLSAYSDEELSLLATTRSLSSSTHTIKSEPAMTANADTPQVFFEFPDHFQQLIQDCEILSEYSDMESSCMDLTLATTASTTWQESVSTFF